MGKSMQAHRPRPGRRRARAVLRAPSESLAPGRFASGDRKKVKLATDAARRSGSGSRLRG